MQCLAWMLLLLAPVWAQERSPMELLKLPVSDGKRIPYGQQALQFGELRVPAGKGPHPVVILVHGGCWVNRIPGLDERMLSLNMVRPIAADLTAQGFATWSIEYRRLGNEGGGWPGTFQDVGAGADHLRRIAKEHRLDLKRVVAIGHSAGGHFALWLAGRGKLEKGSELHVKNPLRLKGVVNLDGPGDLKGLRGMDEKICGAPVITQLMGGTPEEQGARYRNGSPQELLPFGVRQEIFVGRMFAGVTPAYVEAAKRAGDAVNAAIAEKAGHFVYVDPGSAVWPDVVKAIRGLM